MTILTTALSVAAMLMAATSFTASLIFWGLCKKQENTWTSKVPIEKEIRWKMESRRTRYALISIFAYAGSIILALILKNELEVSQSFCSTLMGLGTAGILIVALRALIHNGRSFEASLNIDNSNRPPF